ncbi:MAG: DUF58 domain-containing protein [Kofleriaceae bacterium]|nr:DUF58 domain-containing protein [Kofleriaceae bacterium]
MGERLVSEAGVRPKNRRNQKTRDHLPSGQLARKIRRLEISATALAQSELGGHYHSIFKGQGMEFCDVREYFPGDDVRAIDWSVSARMGKPHVKLFEEERDVELVLMVDVSASMLFGTQRLNKREVAAEIAAVLAFSALFQGDSVGLILFSDKVELFVPPRKGRQHLLRILREIYTFDAKLHNTRLSVATDLLSSICRRRAIGVILSDFQCADWEDALARSVVRHEIVSVLISDPFEMQIPDLGLACFQDLETGEYFEFDTRGPEAILYRQECEFARQELRTALKKMAASYVEVDTGSGHVDALLAYFRKRALQRRRGGRRISWR